MSVSVNGAGNDELAIGVDDPVALSCHDADADDPGAASAAMVSPSTSTSAAKGPLAFTTVPPLINILMRPLLSSSEQLRHN